MALKWPTVKDICYNYIDDWCELMDEAKEEIRKNVELLKNN